MPALLEISEYFVDQLQFEANQNFKGGEIYEAAMEVDFNIGRAAGGDPRFEVKLFISLNKDDQKYKIAPYRISLILSGYFHFEDGTDEETINKMIAPNGLAILYGIARGTVSQITGTSRYGKVVLPSFNFMELIHEKAKTHGKKTKSCR